MNTVWFTLPDSVDKLNQSSSTKVNQWFTLTYASLTCALIYIVPDKWEFNVYIEVVFCGRE